MKRESVWRAVAVASTLGWVGTVIAWMVLASTTPTAVEPTPDPVAAGRARASDRPDRRRGPRRALSSGAVDLSAAQARSPGPSEDVNSLREQVRDEVMQEMEAERAEARARRGERHLTRLTDRVASFAQAHGLDASTQDDLEAAIADVHARMEALRPEGPPGPDGPPPEVQAGIEAAITQLEEDAMEALGDSALAADFVEELGPPPARDGGRRGPPRQ